MKIERRDRLREKLRKHQEDNMLIIPVDIVYSNDDKSDNIKKMEEYRDYHEKKCKEIFMNTKESELTGSMLMFANMVGWKKIDLHALKPVEKESKKKKNKNTIALKETPKEEPSYFVDFSGVKTSLIGKDIKTSILKENIKIKPTYVDGKIKLNFILNDIKIYKTENKVKTILNRVETLFFVSCLM